MLPAMLLVACKKEGTSPKAIGGIFDGTYNGVEETLVPGGPYKYYVQLTISGNNFQSGNTNPYTSMGAGSFQVSGTFLGFTNINAMAGATAPLPLLSGMYNYTVKGDSLLLNPVIKGIDVIITYKLKKQ